MESFKDYLGNQVKVGDRIIFISDGRRTLSKGKIRNITDKKAEIIVEKGGITLREHKRILYDFSW